mgnify:CR=1 FL=1
MFMGYNTTAFFKRPEGRTEMKFSYVKALAGDLTVILIFGTFKPEIRAKVSSEVKKHEYLGGGAVGFVEKPQLEAGLEHKLPRLRMNDPEQAAEGAMALGVFRARQLGRMAYWGVGYARISMEVEGFEETVEVKAVMDEDEVAADSVQVTLPGREQKVEGKVRLLSAGDLFLEI